MGKESTKELIKQGHAIYTVASIEQMLDLKELGGHCMQMDVRNDTEIQSQTVKL